MPVGVYEHRRIPAEVRFWRHVEKTATCWIWNANRAPNGYGKFRPSNLVPRMEYAHRYCWVLTRGAIPNGMTLDHLCRNRACVNPDHMEVVTLKENILRGESVPARNARKTHCKRGHALSGDNVRWRGSARNCIACDALSKKKRISRTRGK